MTGFSYVASSSLRLTLELYRKNYRDYAVAQQFPNVSLANLGDTFNIRDILFPLTSAGRGRAQGIELFVEKKFTGKLYGQANVSFSTSRQAGLDGVLRPASFDYPWIFNLSGGYRMSPKWEFASRLSYLSGRPYTPFDEAVSRQQRRGVFDLSRVNAVRFPSYFRLDIRADRTFTVRGKPLLLFLGAQNVIDRKNIAGYTWNRRTNQVQVDKLPNGRARLALLDLPCWREWGPYLHYPLFAVFAHPFFNNGDTAPFFSNPVGEVFERRRRFADNLLRNGEDCRRCVEDCLCF